jgi:uncharacterized protein involved in outer membrane biogenesis
VAFGITDIGKALQRRWKLLAAVGLAFTTYTLAGFFLVPWLAKSYIESYVRDDLKRQVAIGEISFNPFTFATDVQNFALTEADGSPVVSFDLLRVDFSLSSIFNGAWTFAEVRLDAPQVRVLVGADGSLNLAKLVPPSTEPEPAEPAGVPAVRIGTFAVHTGRVAFDDQSRGRPFNATLTPIEFTLTDFRTAPDFQNVYQFAASTLAGERLTWSGQFSVQPLGSTGKFGIDALKAATITSYLQDALPFDVPSGSVDLEGEYVATVAANFDVVVKLPTLKLNDFAIAPKGIDGSPRWVTLPAVQVSDTTFSLAERKLAVGTVQIDNAKLDVARETDGQINLMRLMGTPQAAPAPSPQPATASGAPAFDVSVGTISVREAAVAMEDRTVRPAASFNVTPISATISGYSMAPNTTLKVDVSAGIGNGRVAAQGDLRIEPLNANLALTVTDFELPPLQPYISGSTAMRLTSGRVSTTSKVAYSATPDRGQPPLQFTGDITIAALATTAANQDFIKWDSLRLAGVDYRQGPDRLNIERVEAVKPYGRVVISADQTLNVATVLTTPGQATAPTRPAQRAPARPAKPASTRAQQVMPMLIRSVVITNGSANFSDFSIQPNFSAQIVGLGGTVTGLSSAANSRAQVKLTGSVDQFAPVDITGTVNILSAAVYTDLAMNFRNMELTTFNPYSGKYAGYNISKGKLTTELKYKVDNRKLDAQHHVVLDQLEFGDATNSKDAVPLPVRLAVALLKDRDGVIDINLPVSGSLDDPQFRVGPIIWQAFVGLLTKIVTAPFALIGSLFGGGEDLQYIQFAAGSSMLAPAELNKLNTVAKGLAERPQLRLDIPLQTLTPADDAALIEAAYKQMVEPTLAAIPADAPDGPQRRLTALAAVYQQQTGSLPAYPMSAIAPMTPMDAMSAMPAPPDPAVIAADIAFVEKSLRERITVTQSARDELARARADAVQAAILANTEVDPQRVFRSERTSGALDMAGNARMELKLE